VDIKQFSPSLGEAELNEVLETFRDNWLTEGPKTAKLEKALREYTGSKHVLMVPNGTLALFVALKVLGIGPGDEVLVPDFTFFGSASAVVLTGAKPVLVDVNLSDFNIDVNSARHCLSEHVKAIMPVHIYGQSCNMDQVISFANEYGLKVVEDAAQGMGVRFGDQHVGTFGNIGCISFFADKTMTTGEGGALLVQDDDLAKQCMYFKNQGRLKRGSFLHDQVGFNFRITDLQAAVGVAQICRLDSLIENKFRVLERYRAGLDGCSGVTVTQPNEHGDWVPFRINILVDDPEELGTFLDDKGIGTRRFFYPLHLQPSLTAKNSFLRKKPVNSMKIFQRGLSLPSSISLTDEEIDYVCSSIKQFSPCRAPKLS